MKKTVKWFLTSAALLLSTAVVAGVHIPGYVVIGNNYMLTTINLKHNPNRSNSERLNIIPLPAGEPGWHFSVTTATSFFYCDLRQSDDPDLYTDFKEILASLKLGNRLYVKSDGGVEDAKCIRVSLLANSMYGE